MGPTPLPESVGSSAEEFGSAPDPQIREDAVDIVLFATFPD